MGMCKCGKVTNKQNKICESCKSIIIERYINGETSIEIGKDFDVVGDTILRIVKKYNIKPRKGGHISGYTNNKGTIQNHNAYVYFISDGKYIKIGVTNNLKKRLILLQMGNANKLNLLFSIKSNNAFELEYSLHQKFKDKLIRGEWFNISEEDIKFLRWEYGS